MPDKGGEGDSQTPPKQKCESSDDEQPIFIMTAKKVNLSQAGPNPKAKAKPDPKPAAPAAKPTPKSKEPPEPPKGGRQRNAPRGVRRDYQKKLEATSAK
eukprot:jgi/Tetstr1/461756/TSEL_006845.t1